MQYAFVDESEPNGTGRGGPYVMVATLPLSDDLDDLRDQLKRAKPKSQAKLHWYESVPAVRRRTLDLLSRMPLIHWAVVVDPPDDQGAERRRRSCMERLLWEMSNFEAVDHIIMESRGTAGDKRDMQMVGGLRSRGVVRGDLRVDHARGPNEPLLWVPDAVCGAMNARLSGDESWCNVLSRQLWVCP